MTICLQLDHVNYSYGAAKIRVLSDVNADFESGKMYAITGPSGAGKSTLLSLLAGLDAPSDGVVRFEGEDIATTGYSIHPICNPPLLLHRPEGCLHMHPCTAGS